LTATVTPSDYDTTFYKVFFSSGDETKATVSATGVVTGAGAGTVTITAEFKYKTGVDTYASFATPITDTLELTVTSGE
jgi:uncharacterized protein YjdB